MDKNQLFLNHPWMLTNNFLGLHFLMKIFRPQLQMMFLQVLNYPEEVVSVLWITYVLLLIKLSLSGYKWNMTTACKKLQLPTFMLLIRHFLYDQIHSDGQIASSHVSINACPMFHGRISVFFSASATFQAPSDPCGPRSMRREYIRATPTWRKGHSRYDCAFVNVHPELQGMRGLEVVRIFLFFSFVHGGTYYPCALVQWFSLIGDEPEDETGLWMVKPELHDDGEPFLTIVHLESIFRAAHLMPAYRTGDFVRRSLTMHDSLDEFKTFYINKFIDHHAFEITS